MRRNGKRFHNIQGDRCSGRLEPKVKYLMIGRAADIDGDNDALKPAHDGPAGAGKK